ncbi:MAG: YraN family protein [Gammaproteobacteria bacterium]|nr:YraN family protein [Gammaproteobacteria bacterium]
MATVNTTTKGAAAEQVACDYLQAQGLTLICRNYHCRYGEIDLVMKSSNELVFVEVRSRAPQDFGRAVESITEEKKRRIIRTAECYLQELNVSPHQFCRFDVVGIDKQAGNDGIEWLPNAFEVEN